MPAADPSGRRPGEPPNGVLARARDHFTAADATREAGTEPVDPIELWGRRIGRALGLVGFLVLLYLLLAQIAAR